MKTTIVPAQITTVEDKIAGNLTFNQLLLMTVPVFLSGAIFAFLPPFMNLRGYKLFICVAMVTVCMTLAIRVKGRILLLWIIILGKYNLRARYYVFNKNNSHLRETQQLRGESEAVTTKTKKPKNNFIPIQIPMNQLVLAEDVALDPRAKLEFRTTKKGDLRVYIQEIK